MPNRFGMAQAFESQAARGGCQRRSIGGVLGTGSGDSSPLVERNAAPYDGSCFLTSHRAFLIRHICPLRKQDHDDGGRTCLWGQSVGGPFGEWASR